MCRFLPATTSLRLVFILEGVFNGTIIGVVSVMRGGREVSVMRRPSVKK
jgi:hypothetical protein